MNGWEIWMMERRRDGQKRYTDGPDRWMDGYIDWWMGGKWWDGKDAYETDGWMDTWMYDHIDDGQTDRMKFRWTDRQMDRLFDPTTCSYTINKFVNTIFIVAKNKSLLYVFS
jgi:hypothetical protein